MNDVATSPIGAEVRGRAAAPGLTLLLCAIVAAVDLGGPMFYPGLGKIASEFGVTPAQAQLAVTVNMIGAAASQPFLGPVGDMFGRQRVLLVSLLALASLSLLAVAVTSFEILIAVRAIQGFLGSAGIVLARAIAHDLFPDQRRFTQVVSYLVITTGACSLVGPLLAGGLVGAYGWRAPVLVLGVFGAVVTTAAFFWFRRSSDAEGRVGDGASEWPGWRALGALLGNPKFYGSTALLAFSMAPIFTLFGLSPMLLTSGARDAPMQVAWLVSILSCGFMAGAFLCSVRADATLATVRIACAAIAVGFSVVTLMMLARGPSLMTIVPGGLIVALASGYLNPVSLTLALQADSRLVATASGWSSAISLAIAAVGTQLATIIYTADVAWLFAVGGVFALLCWISIKPAMEERTRPLKSDAV